MKFKKRRLKNTTVRRSRKAMSSEKIQDSTNIV